MVSRKGTLGPWRQEVNTLQGQKLGVLRRT